MGETWKCYRLISDDEEVVYVKGTVYPDMVTEVYGRDANIHTVNWIEECIEAELEAAWDEMERKARPVPNFVFALEDNGLDDWAVRIGRGDGCVLSGEMCARILMAASCLDMLMN